MKVKGGEKGVWGEREKGGNEIGQSSKEDDRESGGGDKGGGVRKSCHKSAATRRTPAQGSGYKY